MFCLENTNSNVFFLWPAGHKLSEVGNIEERVKIENV